MRTEERDREVREFIRAWMIGREDEGPGLDLGDLEAQLLSQFLGYSVQDVRSLYGPIVAATRAPPAVAAAAGFNPPIPDRMGGARDKSDSVEPVIAHDNLGRLGVIDEDVAELKAFSLVKAPGRKRGFRVKFPQLFERAVLLEMRALELNMKIGQQLYDLDRVRTYVTRLGEIVHRHSASLPQEVIDAMMAEIDQLNREFTKPAYVGDDGAS
jgi:hypothetical protein